MTAASGRVARSQHRKFAKQDAAAARHREAADTGHPGADIAESLQLLVQMRADGSLSEKEFVAAKRKLLAT
jgi:hypothetical protein